MKNSKFKKNLTAADKLRSEKFKKENLALTSKIPHQKYSRFVKMSREDYNELVRCLQTL